jgi:hypothetical protein
MSPLVTTIDYLVSCAKPRYEPWDNTVLLRRYLEALVDQQQRSEVKKAHFSEQLAEIRQQLEEGSFDYESLDNPYQDPIPVWVIVHRLVDVTPQPALQRKRLNVCIDVLSKNLKTDQSVQQGCYPVDPFYPIPLTQYLDLVKQFKCCLDNT